MKTAAGAKLMEQEVKGLIQKLLSFIKGNNKVRRELCQFFRAEKGGGEDRDRTKTSTGIGRGGHWKQKFGINLDCE